jgi:hypothetical protein
MVSVPFAASVVAELQDPPPAGESTLEPAEAVTEDTPTEPAPAEEPVATDEAPNSAPVEPVAQETSESEPVAQDTSAPTETAGAEEPVPTEEPVVTDETPDTVPAEPVAQETSESEPVAQDTSAPTETAGAEEPVVTDETPDTVPAEPVAQESSEPEPVAQDDTPAPTEPAPVEEPVAQDPAEPSDVADAQNDATAPASRTYIWLSPAEIRALPITEDPNCNARCRNAWRLLTRASAEVPGPPNVADLNEDTGTFALAKALVAVRLGESEVTAALREEVVTLLGLAIGTEGGATALAVGRRMVAYIIAADIIDLPIIRPQFDQIVFRPWLRSLLEREFEGRTLRSCQEDRPNNWGTHCGASRIAIAAYLDDRAEMERAASVFRGWLGDRQAYTGFKFDAEAFGWMSDGCLAAGPECQPTPVNPVGALVGGHNVDGVVVDDQRRAGAFVWPPMYTIYSYGSLGGAVVQAAILQRFGFDAWQWGNQALRRAVEWMYYDGDGKTKWDTCGDNNKRYVLDLVDHAYGSNFIGRMSCSPDASREGRNIGWTSWTHQR